MNYSPAASAVLAGTGKSFPGASFKQEDLASSAAEGPQRRLAERIAAGSGIEYRRLAVNPLTEDSSSWTTSARMARYVEEALPLGKEALTAVLADTGVDAADVGLLSVVSSTGYAAPGLDTRLARDIGIPPTVERLLIGHMGCFAALPGLAACGDFVRARGKPAVLINAELSSLHLQPITDTGQLVVASLFADAVTTTVLVPGDRAQPGLRIVDTAAHTDIEHEDYMTWHVGDHGFRMELSPRVPDLLRDLLPQFVEGLLTPHGLRTRDIRWWAVHPGGRGIIDSAESSLGLHPDDVAASRRILRDYGNCASAGAPLVIDELQRTTPLEPGRHGVAIAFGPGLTMYGTLFHGV